MAEILDSHAVNNRKKEKVNQRENDLSSRCREFEVTYFEITTAGGVALMLEYLQLFSCSVDLFAIRGTRERRK